MSGLKKRLVFKNVSVHLWKGIPKELIARDNSRTITSPWAICNNNNLCISFLYSNIFPGLNDSLAFVLIFVYINFSYWTTQAQHYYFQTKRLTAILFHGTELFCCMVCDFKYICLNSVIKLPYMTNEMFV